MPRPPRIEVSGALYHVTARGNERKALFRDDSDRREYLARAALYREKFHFRQSEIGKIRTDPDPFDPNPFVGREALTSVGRPFSDYHRRPRDRARPAFAAAVATTLQRSVEAPAQTSGTGRLDP